MIYVVYTIHVIVCIFLILVVLLQQGKGADLSVFGGGATQTAFGARSAATLLHKLTVVSFVLFILTTMSIAFLQGGAKKASVMGKLLADEAKQESAPSEPVTPTAPSDDPVARRRATRGRRSGGGRRGGEPRAGRGRGGPGGGATDGAGAVAAPAAAAVARSGAGRCC